MINLFIDTHSKKLVIAITKNNKLLKKIEEDSLREHSSKTIATIKKILEDLNIKPKAIDNIYVVNGPGSYTGLRIGVTIAKTYAYTINKKVIPVSSLKAKALSKVDFDYIISKIDARRDNFFAAIYDKNYNEILEEQFISKKELEKEKDKLKGKIIEVEDDYSLDILNIIKNYKNNKGVNPHQLIPNYLKEVYITK